VAAPVAPEPVDANATMAEAAEPVPEPVDASASATVLEGAEALDATALEAADQEVLELAGHAEETMQEGLGDAAGLARDIAHATAGPDDTTATWDGPRVPAAEADATATEFGRVESTAPAAPPEEARPEELEPVLEGDTVTELEGPRAVPAPRPQPPVAPPAEPSDDTVAE
jgi:hypothetical protein